MWHSDSVGVAVKGLLDRPALTFRGEIALWPDRVPVSHEFSVLLNQPGERWSVLDSDQTSARHDQAGHDRARRSSGRRGPQATLRMSFI
jgi:hypothetical protein